MLRIWGLGMSVLRIGSLGISMLRIWSLGISVFRNWGSMSWGWGRRDLEFEVSWLVWHVVVMRRSNLKEP